MRGLVEKFQMPPTIQKETFRGLETRGSDRRATWRAGKFSGLTRSFRGEPEAEMHAFVIQSLCQEYQFSSALAGSVANISLLCNVEFTEDFLTALAGDRVLQGKFISNEVLDAVEGIHDKNQNTFAVTSQALRLLNNGVTAKFTMRDNVFMLIASAVSNTVETPNPISSGKPAGAWYNGNYYGDAGFRYAVV